MSGSGAFVVLLQLFGVWCVPFCCLLWCWWCVDSGAVCVHVCTCGGCDLLTYLLTYLITYLLHYLLAYLLNYLLDYLLNYLLT